MRTVVGIDLGTTYSAIAYINTMGVPEILPNAEGEKLTPSVVLFEGDTAIVGTTAREALQTEPHNVVQLVKRQMGSSWTFLYNDVHYRPEQVSALILRKLVHDARNMIGPIDQAIITVPAYFNQNMRNSTKAAGELAGLEVLALVNEPTAAAVAFGIQKEIDDATIVAYDLGGGTFDVTVMHVDGSELTVLATGGNSFLGGVNFDKTLYEHFVEQFFRQFGMNINTVDDLDLDELLRIHHDWMKRAERLKHDLTVRTQASVPLTAMGKTMILEVRRDEFADMTRVLVDETEARTRQTLAEAHLSPADVDAVLLVGGSTRMPMVQERVESIFNRRPITSINPDEAVVLGASLVAPHNSNETPNVANGHLRITDVAAHTLGVKAFDRPPAEGGRIYNAVVLQRNVPLPCFRSETFFTSVPDQTSITVDVLEGNDPDIALCRPVGIVHIDDLPSGRAAGMPVLVTMHYNTNGILHVEAIDQTTGVRAESRIDRTDDVPREEHTFITERIRQAAVQ